MRPPASPDQTAPANTSSSPVASQTTLARPLEHAPPCSAPITCAMSRPVRTSSSSTPSNEPESDCPGGTMGSSCGQGRSTAQAQAQAGGGDATRAEAHACACTAWLAWAERRQRAQVACPPAAIAAARRLLRPAHLLQRALAGHAQVLALHHPLPRLHPVDVAAQRVDLACVAAGA